MKLKLLILLNDVVMLVQFTFQFLCCIYRVKERQHQINEQIVNGKANAKKVEDFS